MFNFVSERIPLSNKMVFRFAVFVLFLVSVNASLTGPTNILPTLPNAIIKSENSQCQHDSLKLKLGLQNMTLWAQQSKFLIFQII